MYKSYILLSRFRLAFEGLRARCTVFNCLSTHFAVPTMNCAQSSAYNTSGTTFRGISVSENNLRISRREMTQVVRTPRPTYQPCVRELPPCIGYTFSLSCALWASLQQLTAAAASFRRSSQVRLCSTDSMVKSVELLCELSLLEQ